MATREVQCESRGRDIGGKEWGQGKGGRLWVVGVHQSGAHGRQGENTVGVFFNNIGEFNVHINGLEAIQVKYPSHSRHTVPCLHTPSHLQPPPNLQTDVSN